MKKYQIIYADPPWQYNNRANHKTRFRGGACGHYDLMKLEDIKKLPIKELADDNCVLFLWTTFPMIREALEVIDSWGFKYKTVGFNWLKTNPKNNKPFFGVGYYTKSNGEICLLATKGRMKPITNTISNVVISPREEHSKKPDIIREKIVKLFGTIPKIELFARQKVEGWDSWGNEVECDIDLTKTGGSDESKG